VSLENLDFLKSTLLTIDEIEKKIDKKEALKKSKTLIQNDVEEIQELPLIMAYEAEEISQLLAINKWNYHVEGIDALRLEMIKCTEYNSLIKLKRADLIKKVHQLKIKTFISNTKSELAVSIVEKEYEDTKINLSMSNSYEELKAKAKIERLSTKGSKQDLITRIILNQNKEFIYFNFEENDENEIVKNADNLQTEIKKIEREFESKNKKSTALINTCADELSTQMFEHFEGTSPKNFFYQLEMKTRKKIKDENNKTTGLYLFPFMGLVVLTLFSSLYGLEIYFIAFGIFTMMIIFGIRSSTKGANFEINELNKIKELKKELDEERKLYWKLKESLDSLKRTFDSDIEVQEEQLKEKRKQLLELKPILYGFKLIKEEIEQRIQKEKYIQLENKKISNSIDKLQSEIDELSRERNTLWSSIESLIPYSGFIKS